MLKRFLLDLTATSLVADFFYVEIRGDHIDGYHVLGDLRLDYEDVIYHSEYTLFAARHTWKRLVSEGGVMIDPDSPAFQAAFEAGNCHDGNCEHYVCTEGASLDNWDEPEPTAWDYNSEAFGPSVPTPEHEVYP